MLVSYLITSTYYLLVSSILLHIVSSATSTKRQRIIMIFYKNEKYNNNNNNTNKFWVMFAMWCIQTGKEKTVRKKESQQPAALSLLLYVRCVILFHL